MTQKRATCFLLRSPLRPEKETDISLAVEQMLAAATLCILTSELVSQIMSWNKNSEEKQKE